MQSFRRKKTAAERREQRARAEGRLIGKIINSVHALDNHRGSQSPRLLRSLAALLESDGHNSNDAAHDTKRHEEELLKVVEAKQKELEAIMNPIMMNTNPSAEVDQSYGASENSVFVDSAGLLSEMETEFALLEKQRNELLAECEKAEASNSNILEKLGTLLQMRDADANIDISDEVNKLHLEALSSSERKELLATNLNGLHARMKLLGEKLRIARGGSSSGLRSVATFGIATDEEKKTNIE